MANIDLASNANILDAMLRNGPNLTRSAKELNTTSQALRQRIETTPTLKAEWETASDSIVDLAIENLEYRIKEGDTKAIIYAIETFGQHRGFGRQDTKIAKQTNNQYNIDLSNLSKEEKLLLAKIAKQKNQTASELAALGE